MTHDCDTVDLQGYFRRIGYTGPQEPTLAVLQALMAHHLASIPFEAIDVLLGRGVDLAPQAVDQKLITHRRGGYCFEHGSLMRRVLRALGFEAEQHIARVWLGADPDQDTPGPATHTSLKVDAGGKRWLVDVGFGGFVANTPIAWEFDRPQSTDFGVYRISQRDRSWLFASRHDDQWQPLYEILDFDCRPIDLKVANHYTATHPDSHFTGQLMLALTKANERITLAGNVFKRVGLDGSREEHELNAAGLTRVLTTEFGLPVDQALIARFR